MLETIRAYGLERLDAAGERERLRRAHAAYFLELAETAEPYLRSGEQLGWLARLSEDHDNLHVALRGAIAAGGARAAAPARGGGARAGGGRGGRGCRGGGGAGWVGGAAGPGGGGAGTSRRCCHPAG